MYVVTLFVECLVDRSPVPFSLPILRCQKLAVATYIEVSGDKHADLQEDDPDHDSMKPAAGEADEQKMIRALHRLLSARLEKLVAKTDEQYVVP